MSADTEKEKQAHLEALLASIVPQWSRKLRRRWVLQFLPHWREDLLERARLGRYLAIALRRGWFDSPDQTGRWSQFIRLLERASEDGTRVTSEDAVNLFNLAALVPIGTVFAPEKGNLDAALWSRLVTGRALDANTMTEILDEIAPRGAKSSHRVSSPMLRVRDGEAVDARGERWLSGRYSSERWALVYLVEPFGTKSWDGVSQVGISDGRLLAYSKPLGLIATLSPPGFEVAIQRGEPSGYIWPEKRRCELSGVGEVFRASTDLWCGLTRDGAVAFLRESR